MTKAQKVYTELLEALTKDEMEELEKYMGHHSKGNRLIANFIVYALMALLLTPLTLVVMLIAKRLWGMIL